MVLCGFMIRVLNSKTYITSTLILILLLPAFAYAGEGGFVSLAGIEGLQTGATDMQTYLETLMRMAIIAAALIAVIKLIMAGAKYVLSGVVTDKELAKKDIRGALLGLIVILASVTILTTINPGITNLPALQSVYDLYDWNIPQPQPETPDALALEDLRQACALKKTDGYRFIIHTGTWDNPTAGVECCIPNTTGTGACTKGTVGSLNGITLVDGDTHTTEEFESILTELRNAGVVFTQTNIALANLDREKQVCASSGGTAYVQKRVRSAALAPENILLCVTE